MVIMKGSKVSIMKTYQEIKERIRTKVIEWQATFEDHTCYESELAEAYNYFYRNGKKYGLLTEFRENGIC